LRQAEDRLHILEASLPALEEQAREAESQKQTIALLVNEKTSLSASLETLHGVEASEYTGDRA
jgi:hypothetical protein